VLGLPARDSELKSRLPLVEGRGLGTVADDISSNARRSQRDAVNYCESLVGNMPV
jgi:hypothetical protein